MSQHVDKIKVEVTGLSGTKLSVQGFELSVAVNSIPSILLDVLPVESSGKADGESGTSAEKPYTADLYSLYTKLSSMAVGLSYSATIGIQVSSSSYEDCNQSISLKGWILSDVGLSSLTTYSAPTLTVVFKHPIVKLSQSGFIYEVISNPKSFVETLKTASGDNIVSIMDSVYEIFASDNDLTFYDVASAAKGGPDAKYATIVKSCRKSLKEKSFKPGTYLNCTCPLFLAHASGLSGSILPYIRYSIARMAAPQAFSGVSTWTNIISTICPSLLTQVTPTYLEDKLTIEAYEPWQTDTITFDSSKTMTIDMVSVDPDPIYGTAVDMPAMVDDSVIGGATRSLVKSDTEAAPAFYFPEKVKGPGDANGRIDFVNDNQVITELGEVGLGSGDSIGGASRGEGYTPIGDDIKSKLSSIFAEAMFDARYRQSCTASVLTVPAFYDKNNKPIYPGKVATIYDDKLGSKMFFGYINKMTIRGSTSGNCSSMYEMNVARPASRGSKDRTLVEEGKRNVCYYS